MAGRECASPGAQRRTPRTPTPLRTAAFPAGLEAGAPILPMNFLHALLEPDSLLPAGFVAGLLAAVACGLLGPLVITRRIVFLCEGISHAALLGVGAAIAARALAPWLPACINPSLLALATALFAALLLAWLHGRPGVRMDAMIGGLVAVGLSGGVLLAGLAPNHRGNLMAALFGNIAVVGWPQVCWLAALDAVILAVLALFYKQFLALCVDERQLKLQGMKASLIHALLLAMVAMTVVALMQVVGTMFVLALMALPAATAALFQSRLKGMMGWAIVICAVETTLPRALVYGTRVGPEAAIVLSAGLVFLGALGWKKLRG